MTMLEKLAVAIGEKLQPALTGGPPVQLQDVARAAIEAMREPTAEMLAATNRRGDPAVWDCNCHYCGGPKENWEIMMAAALNEKPPGP